MVGFFIPCLTEHIQPTIKEQLEADIEALLDSYSNVCEERMRLIAMLTSQSAWNNRSVKAYLLQHNQPAPKWQFNDTEVRVPKSSSLRATVLTTQGET